MTKADIVNSISDQTGLDKASVSVVVESFMETIKNAMVNNKENIYLRGFGTFEVKRRAPKTGRNITKNTTIDIPAHCIPTFKPGKYFMADMFEATVEK